MSGGNRSLSGVCRLSAILLKKKDHLNQQSSWQSLTGIPPSFIGRSSIDAGYEELCAITPRARWTPLYLA